MELLTKLINNRRFMLFAAIGLGAVLVLILLIALLLSAASSRNDPSPTTEQTTQAPTTESWVPRVNLFGPNDFQFDGDYLTCLTAPSELGVDVCSYQGLIDWQQVAQAGVSFAMIRVGGRGWGSTGTLYADEYAQINYEGAKAAGLKVGAYFFSQAISEEEARQEAALTLELIKDWDLDMPVVFDWELIDPATDPESRTANIDARTLTDCVLAFSQEVSAAGHTPMLYTNTHQYETRLYTQELGDLAVWVALYEYRMTFPYYLDMWQYTDEGTVPGIEGPVDLNLYFPQTPIS